MKLFYKIKEDTPTITTASERPRSLSLKKIILKITKKVNSFL